VPEHSPRKNVHHFAATQNSMTKSEGLFARVNRFGSVGLKLVKGGPGQIKKKKEVLKAQTTTHLSGERRKKRETKNGRKEGFYIWILATRVDSRRRRTLRGGNEQGRNHLSKKREPNLNHARTRPRPGWTPPDEKRCMGVKAQECFRAPQYGLGSTSPLR